MRDGDFSMGRWIVAVTAGESLGFAIPAVVGGALALAAAPTPLVYAAMIVAGSLEGALLGLGQWIGFGPARPVARWRWIAATSAGAAIAWSIGMAPSSLGGIDAGSPVVVGVVVVGGVLLLASIPTLQWCVLRRTVTGSGWWIPANMGAWAVGILWTVAPSPFIDEGTPPVGILAAYIVAGVLMAATVATLTGFAASRVVRDFTARSNLKARGLPHS